MKSTHRDKNGTLIKAGHVVRLGEIEYLVLYVIDFGGFCVTEVAELHDEDNRHLVETTFDWEKCVIVGDSRKVPALLEPMPVKEFQISDIEDWGMEDLKKMATDLQIEIKGVRSKSELRRLIYQKNDELVTEEDAE